MRQSEYWASLTGKQRRKYSFYGWWNWYRNRGHLSLNPTTTEMRRVSWRRKF